ncbi:MAG: hypothetical protein HFK10_06585 [Clostridia bacterium]|nr:hypothetical protein [Clostridia bacterium]
MNKKILTFSSFVDAADAAVAAIAARKRDLDVRHILIVPDKYTLYFEKRLFGTDGGAFDAEVLTFNRLFSKTVRPDGDYLSKQGAVMLIRGILENTELECFGRSAQYKGFAEKMYETITQLTAAGTDILSARAPGALGKKLDDVAAVYRAYRAETAGKFCDASGRLELLTRQADNPYIRNAYFYIANFNGMTAQAARLVDTLARVSLGVTVFDCVPTRGKREAAVYEADDEISQLKSAARRMRALVYGGARYGEIDVVYTGDLRQLKRIFGEYEIPFFVDSAESLATHPLPRFALGAIECATHGYRRADMIALSKNFYAGIDKRQADSFENYCNARLVDYLGFFKPFDDPEAETARGKLETLLRPLNNALKSADAERFARALTVLIAAARTSADPQLKADALDDTAAEKTLTVLDMTASLMRGCRLSTVLDSFTEGLNATDLRALPNLSDTVTVGQPAVFRGKRSKYLLVVGASDGDLPVYTADGGIITDAEADALAAVGIRADPKTSETNARAADELRQVVLSAGEVYLFYPAGKRLSSVIAALLKDKTAIGESFERDAMLFGDASTAAAVAADYCVCRASATELFITGAGQMPIASSISAAAPDLERYMRPTCYLPDRIDAPAYMQRARLGVSEIESYFRCPLKHFFSYGLRLKPRDKGELSSLDVGTFLHETVDRFVGDDSGRPIEAVVNEIVDDLARGQQKFGLEQNAALLDRIRREAVAVCDVVRSQLEQGDFVPICREAAFSSAEGAAMPPIVLDTEYGEVELQGKIDRVDATDEFVRVVDYKTGSQSFGYTGVYYGTKLQLPIYLRAAVQATGKRPAGMFYFPFKTRWTLDPATNLLDGPFNGDEACLVKLDRGFQEEGKRRSTVLKASGERKNGVFSLRTRAAALSAERLYRLTDYATEVATAAVEEMREGVVAASPLTENGRSACGLCDFRPCCPRTRGRTATSVDVKTLLREAEDAVE